MSADLVVPILSAGGTALAATLTAAGVIYRNRNRLEQERAEIESARQKAILELAAERQRIETVEGPTAAAAAWSAVFKVTHESMLSLQADVARLSQRLDDQDQEHRIELEERDRRDRRRDIELKQATDSLRRARSYTSVIMRLLAEHSIAFPPPPDDLDEVAPERRTETAPTLVAAIITENPNPPPPEGTA